MAKESPWDEKLWEPVQVLGLESVGPESVIIQTQAKTMPGEAATVARELRWRIKKAFDEAGILISGFPAATTQEPGAEPVEAEAASDEEGDSGSPAPATPSVPPPASGQR
jgi:small conductance mechanosensitive channel